MNAEKEKQEIEHLRPCEVNGRKALLHKWAGYSEIVPPSLMIGGHGGGVVACTVGIVEYEDGTVGTADPERIRFTDRARVCSFGGVTIKPDGEHELSPHAFKLSRTLHNVTVQILKCAECGEESVGWTAQENTWEE